MNGVLILDKPAGVSSAKALYAVKRLLPRKTKAGHAGTLDPFATGVLLVLIGKATKSCEALMGQSKTYETTIKFGATTETDDPESPERVTEDIAAIPDLAAVRSALARFVGEISQRPPLYSALKINGRRACDRVRDGQTIELKPRSVRIDSIDLLDYAWPLLQVRIICGRGTYIRSIARDLGDALKVGGYLTQLRRTHIGDYAIEQSVTPEDLTAELLQSKLIPVQELP
jgi:tRNA pseudouridine55 synthase